MLSVYCDTRQIIYCYYLEYNHQTNIRTDPHPLGIYQVQVAIQTSGRHGKMLRIVICRICWNWKLEIHFLNMSHCTPTADRLALHPTSPSERRSHI